MRESTVTLSVPHSKIPGFMQRCFRCLQCFNARKMGKHRRGTVKLASVDYINTPTEYTVQLVFAYGRARRLRVVGDGSFEMFSCEDFRPLLKYKARELTPN